MKTIADANKYGYLPSVTEIYGSKKLSGRLEVLLHHKWEGLQKLVLDECDLTADDIKILGDLKTKKHLPSLQVLSLNKNDSLSGQLSALLQSTWSMLKTLDMNECNLTTTDMSAIVKAIQNQLLPSIDQTITSLSSGHIPVIPAMCGAMKNWKELDGSKFDEQDLITIAEANTNEQLPSLKEIVKLADSKHVSGHVRALLCSKWQSLQKLMLPNCNLTKDDVKALGEANQDGYLPCIQEISLDNNKNLSDQVNTLLDWPWPKLKKLDVCACGLTNTDMSTIQKAIKKGSLPSIDDTPVKSLSFGHVPVIPAMCGAMKDWDTLEGKYFDKQDLIAIAEANRNEQLPSLKEITYLAGNKHVSGFVPYMFTSKWQNIEKLMLQNCSLTVEDIQALGDANERDFLSSLQEMNLSNNKNVSGHLSTLLKRPWRKLKKLDVYECNLHKADMSAIHEAIMNHALPELDAEVESQPSGHIPVIPAMYGAMKIWEKLDGEKFDEQDLIAMSEANNRNLLPNVKEIIKLADSKHVSGHVRSMLGSEWQNLQKLMLPNCDLNSDDINALGEANLKGYLPSLQEMSLDNNKNLSDQVNTLLDRAWPKLKKLDIRECDLTNNDMAIIQKAIKKGFLPSIDNSQVKSLSFGHVPVIPAMCGAMKNWETLEGKYFDKQDLITIAEANRNEQLPSLKEIMYLADSNHVSGHVRILLNSKWENLQKLMLPNCDLTKDDVKALGEANVRGYLPSLQEMSLDNNRRLSGQVNTLLDSAWPNLKKLDVYECDLTNTDMSAIHEAVIQNILPNIDQTVKSYSHVPVIPAMSGAMQKFTKLDGKHFDRQDLITIAKANEKHLLPSVEEIVFLADSLRKEHHTYLLEDLLKSPWSKLRNLDLQWCSLTEKHIRALGKANSSQNLPNLQFLALQGNKDISGHLSHLLSHRWENLRKLNLQNCSLASADTKSLLEASKQRRLPNLKHLKIGNNRISANDKMELKQYITILDDQGMK